VTPGGAITIASIAPSNAQAGSTIDVMIKGTNFAPGVAVGFENGSGPAPVAGNVTVLDSTTITLTVTVKEGRGSADRIWDLRVGSAVLANAFEVLK